MKQKNTLGIWNMNQTFEKVISITSSLMLVFSFTIFPISTVVAEDGSAINSSDVASEELVEFISPSTDSRDDSFDVSSANDSDAESEDVLESVENSITDNDSNDDFDTPTEEEGDLSDAETEITKSEDFSDASTSEEKEEVFSDAESANTKDDYSDASNGGSSKGGSSEPSSVPELIRPEADAFVNGEKGFTSQWSEVPGVDGYVYQLMWGSSFDDAGNIKDGSLMTEEHRITAPEHSFFQILLSEQMYGWRVKSFRGNTESDWSLRSKITIDNTAPETNVSLTEGQSFENNIPLTGETTDNWNVDSITVYKADYNGSCSAFTEVTTLDGGDKADSDINWNYDWQPAQDGSFCLKVEGTDYAGNVENGNVIENLIFTTTTDGNGGGGNTGGGGGSSGGGSSSGGSSSGGGRVLGTSDEDLLEALRLLNEVLGTLRDHLLAMSASGTPFPGIDGVVLGEIAQAQEIEGDIVIEGDVMEDEETDEEMTDEEVMEDEETDVEAEEGSRVWLWILFLIIIAILLYLALRKDPEQGNA